LVPVIIIATLLILNAIYVAAEFAVVSSSRLIIEKKALKGHFIAGILYKTQGNSCLMDQYIGSAQMGITVASLAIGMYGEHILAEWFHSWLVIANVPLWISSHGIASILSVVFLTYFHIVIGEMIPKSLSLQKPELMAMVVTPCIIFTKYSFFPVIKAVNYVSNSMIKLMGINRDVITGEDYTSEELEFIVKESQKEGLLKKETGEFFRELLDFNSLTAGEIMVPRVKITGIPFDIDKEGLKKILSGNLHSRYPVYKENLDHIIGMLHIKDIIDMLEREDCSPLNKFRNLPYVPETVTLDKILDVMGEYNTQMAIILDEYGGTAGLVTIEDIFEEVVGEFDEGKISEYLYKDKDGTLHVAGTVRIDEVGQFFNLHLEHEDVTTVSGLILSLLEKPPKMGDTVLYEGIKFRVTALEGYGVKECEIFI
jgi:CBS domain containing-hemolysin-like protein